MSLDLTPAQATVISACIGVFTVFVTFMLNKRTLRLSQSNARELLDRTQANNKELAERTHINSEELEALKARFGQDGEKNKARIAYEFEALKRLYTNIEPLIFQMVDQSNGSMHRVLSLARSADNGSLTGPNHWLAKDGYYMRSTIYRLMAPLATFRLIQKKLTAIDLTLDPRIHLIYLLCEQAYYAFTDDFGFAEDRLAQGARKLPYDPNAQGWEQKRMSEQKVYWRQGFPVGVLDQILDSMAVKEADAFRVMNFGEFDKSVPPTETYKLAADVFEQFHPAERPVFWRMLIAQYYLQGAILIGSTCRDDRDKFSRELERLLKEGIALGTSVRREDQKALLTSTAGGYGDTALIDVAHRYVKAGCNEALKTVTRD